MATRKVISFTTLELKALWLRAELGSHVPCPELDRDPELKACSESALEKVYRQHMNMGPKPSRRAVELKPAAHQGLDLRKRSA